MLSREQQREILAVVLLATALAVLLALTPVSLFGERGIEWFPSENMIGLVGATLRGLLAAFLGASALLVPALLTFSGLQLGGWLSDSWTMRLSVLTAGLLILAPLGTWVIVQEPGPAGWLGYNLGAPLVGFIGWLGALIVTGVGLVALSVGTLGWNPLRSVGKGVVAGGEVAGRTAKALAERGREMAEARAEAAALKAEEDAAAEALRAEEEAARANLEGLAPEWHGDAGTEPSPDTPDGLDSAEDADTGAESRAIPEDDTAGEETPEESDDAEEELEEAGPDDGGLVDPNPQSDVEHEVPPMDLLSAPEARDLGRMTRELDELGKVLIDKLETFNIKSELGGRTTGPVVTQFEVVPAPGVKVNRIANLDADLALAMKARSVRIVAPIPGKGAVGVEIPNPKPEIVNLREVLEAPKFKRAKGELPLALGKDLGGRAYVANLEKMPHVLVAGATGAGKSVCLNTIITSLVYRHTPETLRLLLIDPKMVELSVYARLPHLRHSVVTDPRDAAGVLKWAVLEMERRYALLKANTVRSIAEFNRKVRAGTTLRRSIAKGPEGDEDRWIYNDGIMPYIVVVVDELADLMMTVQSEVEKPLTQLAQKARAIGIHLIVATQRPSVNVITGLIKANFPTRIAFRVASKTDSRTILDQNGADALLGNGDMLFLPPGQSDPVRIQGAYLPTEDTERLMGWYTELIEGHRAEEGAPAPAQETDILEELRSQEEQAADLSPDEIRGDWDALFRDAAEVCIHNGTGSTSLLQRRLSIGYGRAARIVDQLADAGILGESMGAKGREVLISSAELDDYC